MFGKNEIVGRKYFKDAGDKYLVTSIFFTLQGEGPLAGMPAMFLRLAKCNLACSFCDTYFDSGDWMTLPEIESKFAYIVEKYFDYNPPDWALNGEIALIITGGEPSLQNLKPLLNFFFGSFKYLQIETNGILAADVSSATLVVCSPKCFEKNGVAIHYIKPCDATLHRADCLKFVISADPESPYHIIPYWAHQWLAEMKHRVIYVSPMNIYNEEPQAAKTARNSNSTSLEQRSTVEEVISFWTPGLLNLEQNKANHEWAAQYCMQYGLRLSLQQHLYAGIA